MKFRVTETGIEKRVVSEVTDDPYISRWVAIDSARAITRSIEVDAEDIDKAFDIAESTARDKWERGEGNSEIQEDWGDAETEVETIE